MSFNGPAANIAAIVAAWTNSAKPHLTQLLTDLQAVATDLANLEADRDIFENLYAGDLSEWLRIQVETARVGYQPRVSTANPNGTGSGRALPAVIRLLMAINPAVPRDTTPIDTRPISAMPTAQLCASAGQPLN